jgi:pimeloyl-ACP methyl ester carboxylesterase
LKHDGVELSEIWTIVDGLPVYSRVAIEAAPDGSTPLVHVHGFGISGKYLEPTSRLLASDYPTYVPGLPGYGRSLKPKKTLTIPELADAMASYLDEMGVEKANFIGNSMGCLIIIEFAHAYPERIERAILVSKERFKAALDLPLNLTLVFHTGAAHAVNYSHPKELASVAQDFIEDRSIDVHRAGDEIVVVGFAGEAGNVGDRK